MTKRFLFIFLLVFLFSSNSYAEFLVYSIEDKFSAAFPGKPQFTGEIGQGKNRLRSYNFTDEENFLVYAATYQVGKSRYRKEDIPEAIRYYIKGSALVLGGEVISQRMTKLEGFHGAYFTIQYHVKGITAKKYGVVVYKHGHFYQWTIQEILTLSKQDAENIFNTYVKYFSVK